MKKKLCTQFWEETNKLETLNVPWFTVSYDTCNGRQTKIINIDLWGDGTDEHFNLVHNKTKRFNRLFDAKTNERNMELNDERTN